MTTQSLARCPRPGCNGSMIPDRLDDASNCLRCGYVRYNLSPAYIEIDNRRAESSPRGERQRTLTAERRKMILQLLWHHGPMRTIDVAKLIVVSERTAHGVLDEMALDGLVVKDQKLENIPGMFGGRRKVNAWRLA